MPLTRRHSMCTKQSSLVSNATTAKGEFSEYPTADTLQIFPMPLCILAPSPLCDGWNTASRRQMRLCCRLGFGAIASSAHTQMCATTSVQGVAPCLKTRRITPFACAYHFDALQPTYHIHRNQFACSTGAARRSIETTASV